MNAEAESIRRLTLIDAIVLVLSIAVGLMLARRNAVETQWTIPAWGLDWATLQELLCQFGPLMLVAMTPAVILLRLLPPRPDRRRLFTQPGMVGATSAALILAAFQIHLILMILWFGGGGRDLFGLLDTWRWKYYTLSPTYFYPITAAIGASWMMLFLGGRWEPEGSWIDRLGIGVGLGWLAIAGLCMVRLSFGG